MGNQGGKAQKWLSRLFQFYGSKSTSSGHFVTKSSVERGTGAFIYALSADETSPALAAPRHAITVLFSCRKNALALSGGGNGIFTATPTERITHYTLRAKSCAKGGTPLETPDNKRRYAALSGSIPPFVVSSPFHSLRVVPCKLT